MSSEETFPESDAAKSHSTVMNNAESCHTPEMEVINETNNDNSPDILSDIAMCQDSVTNCINSQEMHTEELVADEQIIPDTTANNLLQTESSCNGEMVSFKLVFNKVRHDVQLPMDSTVKHLKEHIASIINVLPAMQKVMVKGLAKDEKTLRELGVVSGSKVMVVGSKLDDVVNVNTVVAESSSTEKTVNNVTTQGKMSQDKIHKKILDKGLPEDVMPGLKNTKESLPHHPLSGMVNKRGGKVRLTFKLELDQVWIGTKERTDKISMNHIRQIVSEPIEGHEQYNMVAFQLGPTEASRYWVYWVPSQYVDAIKDTILGKW